MLVRVVVEQQLDVVREPGGEPAAQRVDQVGDRELQLGGQPLAVDRLGPEAFLRLGVHDRQQDHPALVAGLTGQGRDERRDRQLPRQGLPVGQHPDGQRRGAGPVAVHVDLGLEGVQPVAGAAGQERVEHDGRFERVRGVGVQHGPGGAGVDRRPVLLWGAHRAILADGRYFAAMTPVDHIKAELYRIHDVMAATPSADWDKPSACGGFLVRDVVGSPGGGPSRAAPAPCSCSSQARWPDQRRGLHGQQEGGAQVTRGPARRPHRSR